VLDLVDLQAKLTSERVVLDISSVKRITIGKLNSRSKETYSSIRLQIWHEEPSKQKNQSDQASFATAGTALSGPLRDRIVATSSRLVIFLGRMEEYITMFGQLKASHRLSEGSLLTTQ
jgi:hypothetical protein